MVLPLFQMLQYPEMDDSMGAGMDVMNLMDGGIGSWFLGGMNS